MDDKTIIALFWSRDERAITELTASHKRLCISAAREITGDDSDAEECFSDTCLAVWNSIPPQNPESLRGYVLRICRNFALNCVKAKHTQKRSAILVELDDCSSSILDDMEPKEIGRAIDRFMETLPKREAVIFMRRYYCSQPVKDIAAVLGMKENQISKILTKLRRNLKKHLDEGGIGL
ncbi:MAG: sigma-70 family RNA polymerase sigma factor [Clostridia bacterium]|nr:sigma-70 family RNA polymerase sigma factor [Clostridia bacterium]